MSNSPSRPPRPSNTPKPAVPRNSTPATDAGPLSDDGIEVAKKRDTEDASGAAQDRRAKEGPGVGGDPAVESGQPEHDPERPRQDMRTPPM